MFHKKWRGLDSKELCAVGDRINAESFLAWRETYHAELIKKGLRRPAKDPNRLTGRQFFEAQKALGTVEEEPADEEEDEGEAEEA